ncbi:MAG: FkbM family methyltransferase [Planctomycetaceae bacterium]
MKRVVKPEAWRLEQEYARLNRYPQDRDGVARVGGKEVFFADAREFMKDYERIFWRQTYDFPCLTANPRIIDCSAGTGLAIRYWASRFSTPQIIALEPVAECFRILKKTVAGVENAQVEVHHAALATTRHELGDRIPNGEESEASNGERETPSPDVVRLRDLLTQPVDFLKVCIREDGIEAILDCRDAIKVVRQLCIDYHAVASNQQRFDELLQFLRRMGYRYILRSGPVADRPLFGIACSDNVDFRVDIMAVQEAREMSQCSD